MSHLSKNGRCGDVAKQKETDGKWTEWMKCTITVNGSVETMKESGYAWTETIVRLRKRTMCSRSAKGRFASDSVSSRRMRGCSRDVRCRR